MTKTDDSILFALFKVIFMNRVYIFPFQKNFPWITWKQNQILRTFTSCARRVQFHVSGLVKSVPYVADLWQSWQSWFLGQDPYKVPEVFQCSGGGLPHEGESVVLKARLFNGRISYGHAEIAHPEFKVPKYIENSLYQEHFNTPEAVVKITSDQKGKLSWSVDPKSKSKTSQQENLPSATEDEEPIHLAGNETVLLETRLRYGQISMEKGDLRRFYEGWNTPEYLKHMLNRKYCSVPDGELYVISDETGKLRCRVLIGKKDKVLGVINKVGKRVLNEFS